MAAHGVVSDAEAALFVGQVENHVHPGPVLLGPARPNKRVSAEGNTEPLIEGNTEPLRRRPYAGVGLPCSPVPLLLTPVS